MAHVAPHRWADLDAGKLGDREREAMERHAADCARCAEQRERILSARSAFDDILEAEPSDLGWDHIGARIYWTTSSERRAAKRDRGRVWLPIAIAAAAVCALVVGGVFTARYFGSGTHEAAVDTPHPPPVSFEPAPVEQPAPEPISGVVTFVQGAVQSGDRPVELDRPLQTGDVLRSRDGRIAVQFGPRSGFEIGRQSTLTVIALDSRRVELAIDGTIDVDIEHRKPDQTFAIVAGDRRVEVRGTAFRVQNRDRQLEVKCLRGLVVVREGEQVLDVAAGQRLILAMRELAQQRAEALAPDELDELYRSLTVPMLPAWTEPKALFDTSSTLEVTAEPGKPIEIDGVQVGEGSMRVRVMSGRHQVAGEWVAAEPGQSARAEIAAAAAPVDNRKIARRTRMSQLKKAVADREPRVRQCLRSLEKQGLVEGSRIEFDIGINRDGSQGHLNIVDRNVPPAVGRCLRDVIDQVSFPPGPQTELRYTMSF